MKRFMLLALLIWSAQPLDHLFGSYVDETSFLVSLESSRFVGPHPEMGRCEECGKFHAKGITSALALLNAQRQRAGVTPLEHDAELEQVARKRLMLMVESGERGHPPGSFAPGKYEGVGWVAGHSPSRVLACYSSDPRMRKAGAVMLHVRNEVYFVVVYR
ncbi:CAP domain-containing protein [bacterium]|nr:CAP domain-containing protein [bacterium]